MKRCPNQFYARQQFTTPHISLNFHSFFPKNFNSQVAYSYTHSFHASPIIKKISPTSSIPTATFPLVPPHQRLLTDICHQVHADSSSSPIMISNFFGNVSFLKFTREELWLRLKTVSRNSRYPMKSLLRSGFHLLNLLQLFQLMKKTAKSEVAHEENSSKNVGSDTNTKYAASVQQIINKYGEVSVPHQASIAGVKFEEDLTDEEAQQCDVSMSEKLDELVATEKGDYRDLGVMSCPECKNQLQIRISANDIIEPPWKAYNVLKKMDYPYENIVIA